MGCHGGQPLTREPRSEFLGGEPIVVDDKKERPEACGRWHQLTLADEDKKSIRIDI
jgi:hypothetical protein